MNHEQLIKEADELFDSLEAKERNRMVFRWSYAGNRELGDLKTEVVTLRKSLEERLERHDHILYGVVVTGILGLILAKALGA